MGADEPLYLPASESAGLNQVISRLDYFSSALHEISHWCIAGVERCKMIDFGYWYEPDGRTEEQQSAFERVEVKPQALEWIMTEACGMRFRLSVDNTAQPDIGASESFKENVARQARLYLDEGLRGREAVFVDALLKNFRPGSSSLDSAYFSADKLS